MEFKRYRIEEIGTVVGGGTPSTKNPNYYGGNIPWITPKDLANYEKRYIQYGERNITDEGLKHSSAKLVPANTILMTSRAPIGYLAIAANEVSTNQGFKSIICDKKVVSPKFLYYLLQYEMENIKSLGTGSTFSEISGKVVKNIEVNLPNIENQKKIEDILDAVDEKIETNQHIIANLEELSQTLFKRWFVDFEFPDKDGNPYKSSGGEINDTNNLPPNWKYQSAKHIYTINIGKTPPRKLTELFNTKNGIDWVSISDMKANGPFINITKENLSESAVKEYRVKLVPKNSVLLSFKLTIGRVKITNKELATNEAIAHFVTNTINSIYTYLYLKNFNFESLGNTSSIANAINSKIVKEMPILVPTSEILEKFKEIITPIFEKIELQQKENILLTQLRDTLLPKLMSGEIEIPDDIEVNSDELSI
ncbi:hypothetical protein HMPREF3031_03645 [Staphylococcus sp. HMSC072B07]|uniref:restriction endonuclease subunit S n=1 Tax=Staphylococcus TaxID=1279 RepID=UPI00066C9F9C|nr:MULTISPECIES: restriction endonuclease subunit S [Staphylococcus]MDK8174380.1 restriction endonuclease subunit S [Staphylococcus simulans]OFO49221.1 hypothetical protein HMPREF3031_03645 [Staphylococcus sp. HMSC072B07]OHR05665.1 hypothetical protein HMPREF2721_13130 [Staphylococcus sp. HMSC078A12]